MALKSFIEVHPDSHFPIQNLPYGAFKLQPTASPRLGVAIGDYVLDLSEIAKAGLFNGPLLADSDCFLQPTLNKFLALGRPAWKEARATLQKLLSSTEPALRDNADLRQKSLVPMSEVELVIPMEIGDYTDFFTSMHHAKNCGTIFRGPENPIAPNWFHLPIAYHGRASSVVISGTDIIRPRGQGPPTGNSPPYFGPSMKLDFELEMAAIVGPGNDLGKTIDVNDAADHIFGLVLMNDWSARDIQAWEYVPLGPFLGKSFGTTVSPWIVTLDALEPFACDAPKQDPHPLPYLAEKISKNYDIALEAQIKPSGQKDSTVVTRTNLKNLYWTLTQQLAHHTINGCNLRPGDLLGTGTISGPEPDSLGCLLELTMNGKNPLSLNGGITRRFLEDGDEVIFSGCCKGDGYNVGFGTCTAQHTIKSPLLLTAQKLAFRNNKDLHITKSSLLEVLFHNNQSKSTMKSSRQFNHFGYSSSTTVTFTFHGDHADSPAPPPQESKEIPIETPVPITVHLPQDVAAAKIQSAYRARVIRNLYKQISAVNAEANRLQHLIQRQDTVDSIRSDEREKLKMNETLMRLLLKLDSVPGIDPTVREARRKVSRRIVGLQEIVDGITGAKVDQGDDDYYGGWGPRGIFSMRDWDEVVEEMEEQLCRERGGPEMERFCAEYLGFRCLQRFLRE
ncbi:hypothetical protein COLO4_31878 [Corchorus olitorius]|uniref:Fumarylacetoacetase n=1 Tax=Corchorus olitorius TaxID=93759 RepID=A0A1R3H374_9ROSI|nr:hypothetical protein COLO4_31878 [Corchorus olitorius]